MHLRPSDTGKVVVPGEFEANVDVNIKKMQQGDTIQPIFYAAMETNTRDGECSTHNAVEKITCQAAAVTVSAAPKYNVAIAGRSSYKSTFDFGSGNEKAQDYGDGYGKGNVTGRVLCLGVTLQLYNDNAAKGFKGIEIPDGSDITFDLNPSSEYRFSDSNPPGGYSQGKNVDATTDYMPLLWSCDGNESGPSNSDERALEDSWGGALDAAPYNARKGGGTKTCANGGNWTAVQTGTTINVTVSGYEINMDAMPTQTASGAVKYGEDLGIGCFSAGEIWIVQPYNKIGVNSGNE